MFSHKKRLFIFIMIILLSITACQDKDSVQPDEGNQSEGTTNKSDTTEASTKPTENELPDKTLQKGSQGEEVIALQNILNNIGYSITASGTYDKDTTWAVTDFQMQQEDLFVTGAYEEKTKRALEEVLADNIDITPGEDIPYTEKEEQTEDHSTITSNPYDMLVLVNKEHALPADFIPEDLVIPDVPFPFTEDLPKKMMRKPAAIAMEEMFQAAENEGLELFAQSGYRSYERQEALFTSYIERDGEEAANKYSAKPGESEHQSGLTMDVTSPAVEFLLNEGFGDTEEGKWLEENCSTYGFIIRYPKGKENITKYQYEPWHIRYVGKIAAKEIMNNDITLEEYLATLKQ